DFVRAHPDVLAHEFEERKAALTQLAETVMDEISSSVPVTPVTLVARIFAEAKHALSEGEIIAEIARYQDERSARVWLIRETTAAEIWRAALPILELRHRIEPAPRWRSDLFEGEGVPIVEEAWQWNPKEVLLRDYYANALLTFAEVKRRGW